MSDVNEAAMGNVLHGHGTDEGRMTHRHHRGAEDHDHDSEGNPVWPQRPSRPKMYVIEEIWRDSLENQVDSAIGYKPVAVCLYETTAKRVVREGGTVDDTFCWAVGKGVTLDKYRYKEVPVWA